MAEQVVAGRVVLAEGDGPPPEALPTFDPDVLSTGVWTIRIEANDDAGGVGVHDVSVVVDGQLKLGRFSTTWLDSSVAVSGIPVRVLRTYDTIERYGFEDFGYGWTLDVANFEVATNRPLHEATWQGQGCGGGLIFTDICYIPNTPRIVSVTWPDGRVDSFELRVKGNTFITGQAIIDYVPLPGTNSKLFPANGDESGGVNAFGELTESLFFPNEIWIYLQRVALNPAGTPGAPGFDVPNISPDILTGPLGDLAIADGTAVITQQLADNGDNDQKPDEPDTDPVIEPEDWLKLCFKLCPDFNTDEDDDDDDKVPVWFGQRRIGPNFGDGFGSIEDFDVSSGVAIPVFADARWLGILIAIGNRRLAAYSLAGVVDAPTCLKAPSAAEKRRLDEDPIPPMTLSPPSPSVAVTASISDPTLVAPFAVVSTVESSLQIPTC